MNAPTRGVRLLLGLFAALPVALGVIALVQAASPGWLPSLARRPGWPVWTMVALWLLIAISLLGAGRRPARQSRLGLYGFAVTLVLAAGGAFARGGLEGLTTAIALGVLALATAALGRFVDEARVKRGRDVPLLAPARVAVRERVARLWVGARRYAGFWLCAVLMGESFRWAHVVAVEPQRGVGMLGMLLVFFLLLPAVSVVTWWPRAAATLAVLTALGLSALSWLSGLASPAGAALLCAAWGATALRAGVASGEDS